LVESTQDLRCDRPTTYDDVAISSRFGCRPCRWPVLSVPSTNSLDSGGRRGGVGWGCSSGDSGSRAGSVSRLVCCRCRWAGLRPMELSARKPLRRVSFVRCRVRPRHRPRQRSHRPARSIRHRRPRASAVWSSHRAVAHCQRCPHRRVVSSRTPMGPVRPSWRRHQRGLETIRGCGWRPTGPS
jgi:hypothetical protein